MKLTCDWCQPPRVMGEKDPLEDERISKAICDNCLSLYFPTIADTLLNINITEQTRYTDYQI